MGRSGEIGVSRPDPSHRDALSPPTAGGMSTDPRDTSPETDTTPEPDDEVEAPEPDDEVASFDEDEGMSLSDEELARIAAGASEKFASKDYPSDIGDISIAKLRESVVAPLVAQARGYRTLIQGTDDVRNTLKKYGFDGRRNPGRHLSRLAKEASWMEIPFYRLDTIEDDEPSLGTMQLRPESDPDPDSQVQWSKYMFLAGSGTVIDAHPSTPVEWLRDTDVPVMFTEGAVKADSSLTALLRDAGVPDEKLLTALGSSDPREKLREIMLSIPDEKRVLILAIPGVSSWRQNSEWTVLRFTGGREAWICFDGDIGRNPNVWDATNGLWKHLEKRHAEVSLIDLSGKGAAIDDPKRGVDDYLSTVGRWQDVVALKTDSLPERPEGAEGEKGDTRVSASGHEVELCSVVMGPDGTEQKIWKVIDKVGGRIVGFEEFRIPTNVEEAEGIVIPESVSRSERQVIVHVEWMNEEGYVESGSIRGPKAILDEDPRLWESKHKAQVPTNVSALPAWPPKSGIDWTRAIKGNRAAERSDDVLWACQGWVPTKAGEPVFIAGRQVIGAKGSGDEHAKAGLTADDFPNIDSFGVIDQDMTKAEQRRLLTKVVKAYTDEATFADARFGLVALLAGLRPVVPILPHSVLYIAGGRRSGKSWLAASIAQFWQSRGDTWTNERLPGSAMDSMAWMENAISKSMMWIVDDFAPNSSRQKWEKQTSDLEQMVRSSFNRTSRGRMTSDMKTRSTNPPRAFVVITAENELQVDSVRDRMLTLYSDTGGGFINPATPNPLDAIESMAYKGEQAMLTAQMLRWVAGWIHRDGFDTVRSQFEEDAISVRNQMEDLIRREAGGKANGRRHAGIASEYALSIILMLSYARDLGMSEKFQERIEGMLDDLAKLTLDLSSTQSSRTTGRSLLEALANVLQTQQGYVESAVAKEVGSAPSKDPNVNLMLGYPEGRDPRGTLLGRYFHDAKNSGRDVIVFHPEAFEVARQKSPHLIQHGQTQSRSWLSLWNEGLTADGLWTRQKTSAGKSLNTVDIRSGGTRIKGIPVFLDTLYGLDEEE